jgi:hypothetical protein
VTDRRKPIQADAAYLSQQVDRLISEATTLTAGDRTDLAAIFAEPDPAAAARLVRAYYADYQRAERTPRGLLYLHLGFIAGLLERVTAARPYSPGPVH